MHKSVQPSELRTDRPGHLAEVIGGRRGEIERKDCGLWIPRGDDLVIEGFELPHDAPMQDHRRAVRSAGKRERPAEAP